MNCDDFRTDLTAYLDGELADGRGSALRGHLRGCAACRAVSEDESALRDGLRALPSVDPPPSLWGGVLAHLAAAEEKDAATPAWRRALSRWAPNVPRYGVRVVGAVACAAIALLVVSRLRHEDEPALQAVAIAPIPVVQPEAKLPKPPAVVAGAEGRRGSIDGAGSAGAGSDAEGRRGSIDGAGSAGAGSGAEGRRGSIDGAGSAGAGSDAEGRRGSIDAMTELAEEPGRIVATYRQTADELVAQAAEIQKEWTDDQRARFSAKIAVLRVAAETGGSRRGWEKLIRYLEGALIRDDVALAGGAR